MNEPAFDILMHAADDDILEEAQLPFDGRVTRIRAVRAIAAVFACVILAGAVLWQPWERENGSDGSAAELLQLGYSMAVPADAGAVSYSVVDAEGDYAAPMAQAEFTHNGVQYTCRALKTSHPEDISGVAEEWSESMDWRAGGLDMQLRQSGDTSCVGWYSTETGTQWCLSADEDAAELMDTARGMVETMGYIVAVAPEGAENVDYNVFRQNGLVVEETTFTMDEVNYSYRIAFTSEVDESFADISGTGEDYDNAGQTMLQWCDARMYYNDGGAGKVVWFDVVPGLLYSLSMDSGAGEQALMDMADELFVPAQGEVG